MIKKILFIGSKSLGLNFLKMLYDLSKPTEIIALTIDDSKDERSVFNSFIEFGDFVGLSVKIISKPSKLETIVKEVKPDICFVVGWYWIISPDILKAVKFGFVGIHASLLPKYRGFAPLVWAIINGEKKTGVTLFYFDEGVDNGDVVDQYKIDIDDNDNISVLLDKTNRAVIKLLQRNINNILLGQNNRYPQDSSNASYCSQRKPIDGLINWNGSSKHIHRLIRAISPPYPCAFTYLNNTKLLIVESELYNTQYFGIPGLVVKVYNDSVLVTCGEGALMIKKIKLLEGNIVNASSILKYGDRLLNSSK